MLTLEVIKNVLFRRFDSAVSHEKKPWKGTESSIEEILRYDFERISNLILQLTFLVKM